MEPLEHSAEVTNCNDCGKCVRECDFLKRFGSPRLIDRLYGDSIPEDIAYYCNLCGLCTAICPKGVNPSSYFLRLRRELASKSKRVLQPFRPIRHYESIGKNPIFKLYKVGPLSNSAFFPGCTLPGLMPATLKKVFSFLRRIYPNLGIVFDCCSKPSHDLGDINTFEARFSKTQKKLLEAGVKEVLVACPSCYKIFKSYGSPLYVKSIYEILEKEFIKIKSNRGHFPLRDEPITVHDPCPLRFETDIHRAVRKLLKNMELKVIEMPHSKQTTYCCGEGGAVSFKDASLSIAWAKKRYEEMKNYPLVTYCAGCNKTLTQKTSRIYHILDLIFEQRKSFYEQKTSQKSIRLYLNRLKLKWYYINHEI